MQPVSTGGGVIRDQTGRWYFGFATKFRAKTPLAAELLAVKNGLMLCKEHGIDNLMVEIDAKSIKEMLDKPRAMANHEVGVILDDVLELLDEKWNIQMSWTKREANKLAHLIANMGYHINDEREIFIEVLDCLREAYQTNLIGNPSLP